MKIPVDRLDEAVKFANERLLPTVRACDGSLGMSMAVNRENGSSIMVSSWKTREAMVASEPLVDGLRAEAAVLFGDDPLVGEWEIAAMHRASPSSPESYLMVTWAKVDHGDTDAVLELYQNWALPQVQQLPGFQSSSVMVMPDLGNIVGSVSFVDRLSAEQARGGIDHIRREGIMAAKGYYLDLEDFDLVIAHLDVPEYA
ncbi:MAG TPA: hypothetical protein VFK41_10570 [Nocardioidaceae bacterium]|nr:hypothetical protein [Nocardioidaceae bacterium]